MTRKLFSSNLFSAYILFGVSGFLLLIMGIWQLTRDYVIRKKTDATDRRPDKHPEAQTGV